LQRLAVALVLAIFTALGFMSAISNNRAHALANRPIRWLLAGAAITAVSENAEISHILQDTRPFVMGERYLAHVPPDWKAVPLISLKSFGAIKDALRMDSLGAEIRGVMYDYEAWRFTSEEEQKNPAGYVKPAAELVHARGLLFLTAPAVNLVTKMAPAADRRRLDDTYLSLGIAADAARFADVFDIQAQRFEYDTDRYASFVRRAAMQARGANPKVLVFAGVSTQPFGPRVTADDIFRAIVATRDIVDGYWFNIPQPSEYSPHATEFRPDIAIDVLHRLAGL